MTPKELLRKRFNALAKNLKDVRKELCTSLSEQGICEELRSDIVLAVDEACQNIIRHAYHFDSGGMIDLMVYLKNNELMIELVDFAEPVNPSSCKPTHSEPLTPGGLGTVFMHQLMDSVQFIYPAPEGVGNKLIMTRRLNQNDYLKP